MRMKYNSVSIAVPKLVIKVKINESDLPEAISYSHKICRWQPSIYTVYGTN